MGGIVGRMFCNETRCIMSGHCKPHSIAWEGISELRGVGHSMIDLLKTIYSR
jgi:hypothetical protein